MIEHWTNSHIIFSQI